MKKLTALILSALLAFAPLANADQVQRYRQLKSCVFAEDLGDYHRIQEKYTINGNPTIVNSPLGKAMSFDGTNDYITLPTDIEKDLRFDGSTQDFSISCWIKASNLLTGSILIDKRDANDDGWAIRFVGTGEINFAMNTIDTQSTTTVEDDVWHYITVTADRSGNAQIYIDGVADGDAEDISGQTLSTTAVPRLCAGSYGATAASYTGAIKNLMIFDRLLTQAEITALATNNPFDYEKNVISEWDMSNINPQDVGYRGLGNNGTGVSLTAASIVNGVGGGKATEFDGSADYIDCGDKTTLDITKGTICAWVNVGAPTRYGRIAGKSDYVDANKSYFLGMNDAQVDNKIRFQTQTSAGAKVTTSTTSLKTGTWYFVVGTYDGINTSSIYINGNLENSDATNSGNLINVSGQVSFRIGVADDSGYATSWFSGQISDVKLYNVALTQLEVADLYNKQRSGRR